MTRRILSAVIAAIVCGGSLASAQSTGYPAVFERARTTDRGQTLGVGLSWFSAYDFNNIDRLTIADGEEPLMSTGLYSTLQVDADYQHRGRRLQFGANGGTSGRVYADSRGITGVSSYGGASLSTRLGSAALGLSQRVSRGSSYFDGLFTQLTAPSASGPAVPKFDLLMEGPSLYQYTTDLSLSQGIGGRGVISAVAAYRLSDVEDKSVDQGAASPFSDSSWHEIGASYSHGLARGVSLRLGYLHRQVTYSKWSRPPAQHDVQIGVDYRKALSFSRNTTISFGTGSTIVSAELLEVPGAGALPSASGNRLQFRLVGDAELAHRIGRTWSVRAAYRRGGGFVEGLSQPIFVDGLTLSSGGFLNRRIDVRADASYSSGQSLFSVDSGFRTYTASAQIRAALNRVFAAQLEYFTFVSDFGPGAPLFSGLPRNFSRHTVRGGLTLWIPLKRR